MGNPPPGDESRPAAEIAVGHADPVDRLVDALFHLSDIQQAQNEQVADLAAASTRQQGELTAVHQAIQAWEASAAHLREHEVALGQLVADLQAQVHRLRDETDADQWQRALADAMDRAEAAVQRAEAADQRAASLEAQLADQREQAASLEAALATAREQAAGGERALQEADALRAELDQLRSRLAEIAQLIGHAAPGS